ncbi:TetR/AcrR family transcriptional regulator [Nocardioides seonyuensis]|uniref:TetR/AcrR family transcriptional regulator n=1 Tax=Nocardioides seonyuensis TaxID=2518371 RepID=A0A4P7IC63_9ACTN|nr:TetR/AcrR family transcriptional regulator [Nocardioides seonyuensis]QBX54695.1 TetR/AcrR family transcriptional regulator [Nocardioides seonyuensis]
MTSIRNTTTEDRLLDAARDSILSVGWRRTTLTDVARRAGVSRMTVYRTYPDMTGLLGDLMTREWLQMLAELEDHAPGLPAAERIAARVLAAVRALRANPLFHRIVDVDPELLLPYLLERRGRSQSAVIELLADAIATAQADGEVRAGDPPRLARSMVLAAHGFALSHQTMTDDEVGSDDLDADLVEMITRFLTP